jgi:S1-C subfamily serine protease
VGVVGVAVRERAAQADRTAAIRAEMNVLTYELVKQKRAPDYWTLQHNSVRIDVGMGYGSGVLVTRQVGDVTRTYVWTAGHVAAILQNEDGTFRNATIYQEYRVAGKFRVEGKTEAKVIAYSEPDDEDLALLEVLKDNFRPIDVAATFASDDIPGVGTELVHVGSTLGLYNSVSLGIISQTDRNIGGKMFDQTSCMGYPGSSGGGVYLRDGQCIGLLTRGAGPGLNFIVPVRRMRSWAKKAKIEWALNPAIKMPLVREPTSLESVPAKPVNKDSFSPLHLVPVHLNPYPL